MVMGGDDVVVMVSGDDGVVSGDDGVMMASGDDASCYPVL